MPVSNSYESVISAKNPKIWFRFNETAGTPVNAGSLTCTLTASGTPALNADSSVDGRAVSFPNTGSYYTLTNFPAFSLFDDRSFTVETWFKMATRTDTVWPALFSFGTPGYTGQFFFARLLGTNSSQVGRLDIGFKPANGYTEYKNYTSQRVDDNKWHHLVITINTTSMKTYIDGALSASATITTPSSIDFDDSSTEKYFGTLGTFDEFAMYDRELTAAEINANYVAGNAVYFLDIPGTASAEMAHPTFQVNTNSTVDPMNASALLANTEVSNYDYVDSIQTIISSMSPQQWIKFNRIDDGLINILNNYGSGGQASYSPISIFGMTDYNGPGLEGYSEFQFSANQLTTTTSAFFTDEISDNNFSIGLWFKVGAITTDTKTIFKYDNVTNSDISLRIVNKKLEFDVKTSHTNYTYTTSADITSNVWHFAVIKLDLANTTAKYYLDGSEVYSQTGLQGGRGTPSRFRMVISGESSDTTRIGVSHLFVTSYADATTTKITNLWNATSVYPSQAKGQVVYPILRFNNKFDDHVAGLSPIYKLGLNETTGTTAETVGSATNSIFTVVNSNYTRGDSVLTKNRYGYNFTNKNTYINGSYATNNFSDNTKTESIYAKINTVTGSDFQIIYLGGAGGAASGGTGFGLSLCATAAGPALYLVPTSNPADWRAISAGTSYFGDWHLYTLVRDGSSVKLYVDGKQVGSTLTYSAYNFTNNGVMAIGGGETVYLGASAATVNKFVDEVAVFDYALTDKQIFEMWQSIEIDRATASSTFPMPTNIAGTGTIQDVEEMIATTSTLPMPIINVETNNISDHLEAFAEFLHPNYGADVNVNANYGHSAFTASALFHMPGYDIGEINFVVHMEASATMPTPVVVLPGQIQVSPMVASSAELVMPGIVTIKGARIFAETLNVRAIFPLPPAYEQLTDDNYYVRLYAEHSQKTTEAAQTFAAAGTATTGFTAVAKSFLKFFNDVTQDITVGSSRFLINEMPDYVYDAIGTTYTDNNGNTVAPPTTRKSIVSSAPRGSLTPTPIVSQGYFDAWDRKAVNFTNIEFNFGTDSQNHSQRQYSVEFTIKTTKSNQVMTYGNWASFYNYGRSIGTIGLFNGKLYSMESFQNIGKADVIPHPANLDALSKAGLNTGYMLGNKRIDDGQWHHVVIQYGWTDGRTQYWIDGELDRQMIGTGSTPGSNGKNGIRPFIVGFNSNDTNLSSDFQTSVWSWTPNKFLLEQDISINYEAAYKFSPIFADPMLANVTATPDNQAAGNRGRALMLYFWPTNTAQRGGNYSPTFDAGGSAFDVPTFDPLLDTVDYIKYPPQEYEGWDVFPVDVAGYFVSDLVKVEAYGGPENILLGDGGGAVLTTGDANRAKWKFNARGTFRDALTDAPRYIDLVNDIDLTQFDAIFFKNFPDQSNEIDRFAKDEVVDSYFSIRELKIYEDFIKSLRAAVDSGMSLYVTNTELAIDLGIIDRVEIVSDMDDIVGYESDVYAPTHPYNTTRADRTISDGTTVNVWKDTYKNNRFRLVNEVPGMTDFPTVILTDRLYWTNDDQIRWGGADTNLVRLVIKPNGLAVGDEWIESTYNPQHGDKFYEAVPFANIKAGKPVVAFANQVRRDLDLIDNPYKNHATVIVVEPGNPLNGSLCGGKIYVNFTERLKDSVEDVGVDLIQDTWINYAESEGLLTAEEATDLRTKTYNIDRQLAAGTITQSAYDQKAYWSSNSDYILQQNTEIGDASDTPGKGGIAKPKSQRVRKINKNGGLSFTSTNKGSQWFSVAFSWLYPRMTLDVPSMLTRGFWWVSNKEQPEGTVVRVLAMTASATSGQAIAVPDKIISASAQAMVASAKITETFGYTPNSINNVSLPMQASALMTDKVFKVDAEPMRVTAAMTQLNRALTSSVDEVIVYIMHEDPILYLREEVIK